MPSLYKYIPEKYVDNLVRSGHVLFRSLSYFRDYEDAQVRGDEFEGTKLYRPQQGLDITVVGSQERFRLPHTFESTTNEDDIFVFCLSTVLSAELAEQFKTSACVEIFRPDRFLSGIRAALQRRPSVKNKMLVHGEINYYKADEPPIVDWALPEKITMSKLALFQSQQEYRIAFATNGAFKVENTHLRLVPPGEHRAPRSFVHPERLLKLGSLAQICTVHRFC